MKYLKVLKTYETWPKNLSLHLIHLKIFSGYFVVENFKVYLEALV
jgi:hypothetical protein